MVYLYGNVEILSELWPVEYVESIFYRRYPLLWRFFYSVILVLCFSIGMCLISTHDVSAAECAFIPQEIFVLSSDGKISPREIILPGNLSKYKISMQPDVDVGDHIVVLTLVLNHLDETDEDLNLFDEGRGLHGYQEYIFPASDLLNGAAGSVYGEIRDLKIKENHIHLKFKVQKSAVRPIPGGGSKGGEYEFTEFKLHMCVVLNDAGSP